MHKWMQHALREAQQHGQVNQDNQNQNVCRLSLHFHRITIFVMTFPFFLFFSLSCISDSIVDDDSILHYILHAE